MENTSLAEKIKTVKSTLPTLARNTLRKFANEFVKKLQLVTKSYKYDFPFYGQSFCRSSNYRLACLLERQLYKKVPYLTQAIVPFISKGRTGMSIFVQRSPGVEAYLTNMVAMARRASIPLEMNASIGSCIDSNNVAREALVLYVGFNQSTTNESYGYVTIFYLNEIAKILETLHRKAFYE